MIARLFALVLLTGAMPSLASQTSKKWQLSGCTSQCLLFNQPTGNMTCVTGRCLPEVRFAASVANSGGMTLNGSQAIPYATALSAMRSAFERWTSTSATCSTSMQFAFAGSTFNSPSGTNAVSGNDDNNNVILLGGSQWRYSSGTLGVTSTWTLGGQLSDADMELNNNTDWGDNGAFAAIDFESVVTHEAGHFIGIDHTTSANAIMNPAVSNGVIKRALLAPDLSDLCGMYPGASGGQGTACTSPSVCTGGRVCEGPTGTTNLICTQDCTAAGQSCPTGYTCQASTASFACLPQQGAADQCTFCTSGSDCSTGVCVTDGNGHNWCSQSCNPTVSSQCGASSECVSTSNGGICAPTNPGGCVTQCTVATAATDCAPGYGCVGGQCEPTGAVGDRCDISGFCTSCSVCVVDSSDPNIAFCRACCNNAASLCTGCTATTCQPVGGMTAQCVGIQSRSERICVPVTGASLCQACNASTPCASGTTCVAGVCRASCNPSSPGACPACFTQGAASVCVCSTAEIAAVNQPCTTSGNIKVCQNGLQCVSGTCRQPCTPGTSGACASGFACQSSGSGNVCLPSAAGGGGGGSTGVGGGGGTTGAGGGGGGTTGEGGGGGTTGEGGGSGGGGGDPGVGGGGGETGGGTGGGTTQMTCGPGTCAGCCRNGTCVSPAAESCGSAGSSCVTCASGDVCESGSCATPPPEPGCGCSNVELGPMLVLGLLALAFRRRRAPRTTCENTQRC